jgi:hypothetical protein
MHCLEAASDWQPSGFMLRAIWLVFKPGSSCHVVLIEAQGPKGKYVWPMDVARTNSRL